MSVIPERPIGVPVGARYFPPADDMSALETFNRERADKRSRLRVQFPFLLWTIRGPMRDCGARFISARPTRYGEEKCFLWSDESEPLPGVWAWTLADERATTTPVPAGNDEEDDR